MRCRNRHVSRDCFFFSSRRRHTRLQGDWSSDVCSSDLITAAELRTDPQRYAGQVLRWTLQFISTQQADELRPEIPNGATYMLARGPLPERGFVISGRSSSACCEIGRAHV